MRKEGLEKLLFGRGGEDRKKETGLKHIDGLTSAVGCSVIEVLRRAGYRISFNNMIADNTF